MSKLALMISRSLRKEPQRWREQKPVAFAPSGRVALIRNDGLSVSYKVRFGLAHVHADGKPSWFCGGFDRHRIVAAGERFRRQQRHDARKLLEEMQ